MPDGDLTLRRHHRRACAVSALIPMNDGGWLGASEPA
jgi:hypothetical protein